MPTRRANVGQKGPIVGPYATIRLTNETVTGADEAPTVRSRLHLGRGFHLSQVCYDLGGGASDTIELQLKHQAANTNIHAVTNHGGAGGAPLIITPNTLRTYTDAVSGLNFREVGPEENISLVVGSDAVSTGCAVSEVAAYLTGFFLDHVKHGGRYAHSGQGRMSGPVAGYKDCWSILNTTVSVNGEAVVGRFVAPYDARIEAIIYNWTTDSSESDIFCHIENGTTPIHLATFDLDVNKDFVVDANSSPPFISSAVRDISKGDAINLMATETVGAGAITLGSLTAHVIVHCKGHVAADPLDD